MRKVKIDRESESLQRAGDQKSWGTKYKRQRTSRQRGDK